MLEQNTRKNIFAKFTGEIPLYGLVLAGGRSTRMNTDKSLLNYHGKTQVEHCFDLLSPFCAKVFISNRADQFEFSGHKGFPQIHDFVAGIGPLGGMLSAMTQHPNAAWMVLACDLPHVTSETLQSLINNRNRLKIATAYKSMRDGSPEPLCAIYEPKSLFSFLQFLTDGHHCPRKILIHSDIQIIEPTSEYSLENINDLEEYQRTQDLLKI